MPRICWFVKVAYDFNLAITDSAKQDNIKLDIFLEGIHFPIAIHDLELRTDFAPNFLISLNKVHSLVIRGRVQHGLRV